MTEKVIETINIKPDNGKRILSGRKIGALARKKHSLEDLDANLEKNGGVVEVRVEAPVMTSSFAQGMFYASVRKFGEDGFYSKYKIYASDYALTMIRASVRQITTSDVVLA